MRSEDVKQFALIIVQSLGELDLKTADILPEEIIKFKKFQESNLHSEIHDIKDKAELFVFLHQLNARIKGEGLFPILHLETHGYDDGIQLMSGEKCPGAK